MKKDIRKVGGSRGIVFNVEEAENYGLIVGKVMNIQKFRIEKKKYRIKEAEIETGN